MNNQTIAVVAIFVALFSGYVFGLHMGLSRTELLECQKWQLEADKYVDYFISGSQREQCDSFGISIEAPTKLSNDLELQADIE